MISMSKEPAHDMVADMELEAEMPAPPVFAPFGGLLGCPMSFSSDSSTASCISCCSLLADSIKTKNFLILISLL